MAESIGWANGQRQRNGGLGMSPDRLNRFSVDVGGPRKARPYYCWSDEPVKQTAAPTTLTGVKQLGRAETTKATVAPATVADPTSCSTAAENQSPEQSRSRVSDHPL
jgi:hypothetical protein